jgi:hypothetical protein
VLAIAGMRRSRKRSESWNVNTTDVGEDVEGGLM